MKRHKNYQALNIKEIKTKNNLFPKMHENCNKINYL